MVRLCHLGEGKVCCAKAQNLSEAKLKRILPTLEDLKKVKGNMVE